MTIPALPDAPALGDSPEQFNAKAFAFVAALDDWGTAANAVGADADADAASAAASASTATTQAGIATAAAGTATTQAGIATTKAGEAATSANLADASADAANLSAIAADASADAAAASAASIDPASLLTKAGNLSGLASPATARDNLGVEIGVDVQAFNAALAAIAANNGTNAMKNRIINGAMMIDQRNAGASVTVNSGSDFYAVDRWPASGESADGVFTVQRSSTAPAGFTNSLLATVTTADASIGSTQRYFLEQKIEGFNVADLGFGTANAQTFTLSFWVRSSVTGTFGGTFGSPSGTRYNPFSYTISAANTWEQKTVTVAGDTSGTWLTTTGVGLEILFSLGCGSSRKGTAGTWAGSVYLAPTGSVDLIATNGATFYITGVQLEKGSTATSFDYRPYGTELALCRRYLPAFNYSGSQYFAGAFTYSTTNAVGMVAFDVTPRVIPTGISVTGSFGWNSGSGGVSLSSPAIGGGTSLNVGWIGWTGSGMTQGQGGYIYSTGAAQILFTGCEL